jgi:molybdate transport system substrate-binding protein
MSIEPGADRVTGISSMAMRQVLADLVDEYRQRSSVQVAIESVGGVDASRRIRDGEAFDFVVLASDALRQLADAARIDATSRVDLARSGVAMAVRAGSRAPDVGNEAAVRDAVLRARSIGYSTGPSGAHLVKLFEHWGIAATVAPRILQAPPGIPVATLVARGDVELGFQQLSELIHAAGIDVIGPLPPGIQMVTVFSAAVCTVSNRRAAARDLLAFFASPAADATKRRHGMDPATTAA